jgi:hypothetical protein
MSKQTDLDATVKVGDPFIFGRILYVVQNISAIGQDGVLHCSAFDVFDIAYRRSKRKWRRNGWDRIKYFVLPSKGINDLIPWKADSSKACLINSNNRFLKKLRGASVSVERASHGGRNYFMAADATGKSYFWSEGKHDFDGIFNEVTKTVVEEYVGNFLIQATIYKHPNKWIKEGSEIEHESFGKIVISNDLVAIAMLEAGDFYVLWDYCSELR